MASKPVMTKDLSPAVIKKMVLNNAVQQPLTVYPASVSFLGLVYTVLFGVNPIGLSAFIVGGVLTLSNWGYQYYIKGDAHALNIVKDYRIQLQNQRNEMMNSLEKTLQNLGHSSGLKQVTLFRDKFNNFHDILNNQLDERELTYNRYLSIAEQVFLAGLDNLDHAAMALKSISAIDAKHLHHELKKMQQEVREDTSIQQRELESRLTLREDQLNRVQALLIENEKALTQLDQVSTRIANINTRQGRASIDMEAAMSELKHLILRTDRY